MPSDYSVKYLYLRAIISSPSNDPSNAVKEQLAYMCGVQMDAQFAVTPAAMQAAAMSGIQNPYGISLLAARDAGDALDLWLKSKGVKFLHPGDTGYYDIGSNQHEGRFELASNSASYGIPVTHVISSTTYSFTVEVVFGVGI